MGLEFEPAGSERPLATLRASGSETLDAIDAATLRAVFAEHGALLIRGFDGDPARFAALGRRLCSTAIVNDSPNRRPVGEAGNVYSVDLGVDAFPLHSELAREPFRPDVCMFACFSEPGEGGETTVCDGEAILAGLDPALAAELTNRRAIYIQPAKPDQLAFWLGTDQPSEEQLANPPASCPYRFRRTGERVIRYFSRPIAARSRFRSAPAFANFILFARDYLGLEGFPLLETGEKIPPAWLDALRSAGEHATYAHRWQRGDVLVIDNSRFMHGRRRISHPRERDIATYFGFVDFGANPAEDPDQPVWRAGDFVPPGR